MMKKSLALLLVAIALVICCTKLDRENAHQQQQLDVISKKIDATDPQVGEVWEYIDWDGDQNPFKPETRPTATVVAIKDGWVQYDHSRRFRNETKIEIFKRIYRKP